MPKKVLIASDHAGFALKSALIKLLPDWQWIDLGPSDASRVDYPDFAEKLSRKIAAGEASQGVLICGSGIGMSIAANKIDRVRAAVVENPIAAKLAKLHFSRPNMLQKLFRRFWKLRSAAKSGTKNALKKLRL
jgi:ribose 5-phosphate isomerase B